MGYEKNWWGFSLSLRLCFNIGSYWIVIYCVIEIFSNVFNPYLVGNQLILYMDWITSMKTYYKKIENLFFKFDLNLFIWKTIHWYQDARNFRKTPRPIHTHSQYWGICITFLLQLLSISMLLCPNTIDYIQWVMCRLLTL